MADIVACVRKALDTVDSMPYRFRYNENICNIQAHTGQRPN
jgi:hypothetical protein